MNGQTEGDAVSVKLAIERAAYVFYRDGRWTAFSEDVGESRLTQPDAITRIQFNHLPGKGAHAEYRGPLGYWWVRIDAGTGMPAGEPVLVPPVDQSSRLVN